MTGLGHGYITDKNKDTQRTPWKKDSYKGVLAQRC